MWHTYIKGHNTVTEVLHTIQKRKQKQKKERKKSHYLIRQYANTLIMEINIYNTLHKHTDTIYIL